MRLTYLGHSAVLAETTCPTLLIDPFPAGNAQASVAVDEITPDYLFITHARSDHECLPLVPGGSVA